MMDRAEKWLLFPGRRARYLLLLLVGVTSVGGCAAPSASSQPALTSTSDRGPSERADEPRLTSAERDAQLESFDIVWSTIGEKHWDPTLGGLDWSAVREEFRPRVATAPTASAAREVMREMIQRLRQSHFGIIPVEVYSELAQADGGQREDGTAGLRLAVVDGQALVREIEADSAAAAAGVRRGWIVERVGDADVAPLLTRIGETYADSTLLEARLIGAVESRLQGRAGEAVAVSFRDGTNEVQARELTLRTPRGKRVGFGNLPPQYVICEHRALADGIGYIYMNVFLDPGGVMGVLDDAIAAYADAPGVVLDLRGNPGGIVGMGSGLAGYFLKKRDHLLGTMRTRSLTLKLTVNPRSPSFGGPLAVLIDGASASTSEFVAAGLKDAGRAQIFGSRSAGAALPSVIIRLPNGDGFQHAVASYVTAGGEPLEGVGVAPHQAPPVTRAALLAGADPVLEAASAWIRARNSPSVSADRANVTMR